MPPTDHPFHASDWPSRFTAWVLKRLAGKPAHGSVHSVLIIISVVAVIGWLDYISGPRLSLELFYLIPISLSVAWLNWPVGCVTAVTSILVRVGGDLMSGPYLYPRTAFWNRFVDLLMYFVIIWVLHALITLQR